MRRPGLRTRCGDSSALADSQRKQSTGGGLGPRTRSVIFLTCRLSPREEGERVRTQNISQSGRGPPRHRLSVCQLQGAARRPTCGEHGDRGTRLLTHVNVPARSWRLGFHAASNELSSITDREKGGSQPRTQEEKTKSSLLLRTWAIYTPLSRTRTVSTSE